MSLKVKMSFEPDPIAVIKITFDELSPEVKHDFMTFLKLTSALMLSSIVGIYTILAIYTFGKICKFIQYITNTRYTAI